MRPFTVHEDIALMLAALCDGVQRETRVCPVCRKIAGDTPESRHATACPVPMYLASLYDRDGYNPNR